MTRRAVLAGALGVVALAACGRSDSGALGAPDVTAPATDEPRRGQQAIAPGSLPGKLLYVGDANVWVWEKGSARRLTNDRISRQPSWSPDGKRIAHVKIDVNSSELWVMDADSSNSRQLTHSYDPVLSRNNWAFRPEWWPDGARLVFVTEEGSNDLMIWQIGLDGKNRKPFLTVPDGDGGLDMPGFSPDGKRLSLISYRGPGLRSQIWTFGLPNGPWRQLTETDEGAYDPAWSPDGTRIAYVVRSGGKHDLWVMDADGTGQRQITSSGVCRAPCWSPDGQYLAYVAADGNTFDVWALPSPAKGTETAGGNISGTSSISSTGGLGATGTTSNAVAPAARLTRGAQIDTVSGLSWTK